MKKAFASMLAVTFPLILLSTACSTANREVASRDRTAETISIGVDGYPIDRSLEGVSEWGGLEVVVVLSAVEAAKSVWLTPDGRAPQFARAINGSPVDDTGQSLALVTPVSGRVTKVLWGDAPGDTATFFLTGGVADGVTVEASDEVSAKAEDVVRSGQVVVAGSMEIYSAGPGINPAFIYAIDADGETITSLLESVGDESRPVFKLSDLEERLRERAARTGD